MKNGTEAKYVKSAARGASPRLGVSSLRMLAFQSDPDKPAVRDPSACVIPPRQRGAGGETEKERRQRIDRTACW